MGISPLRQVDQCARRVCWGSMVSAVGIGVLTAPALELPQVDQRPVALPAQVQAGRVEARKPLHTTSSPASAIGYRSVVVARTPAHVVQVDLRRQGLHVSVALTEWGIGG